jgi:hypothetical protein
MCKRMQRQSFRNVSKSRRTACAHKVKKRRNPQNEYRIPESPPTLPSNALPIWVASRIRRPYLYIMILCCLLSCVRPLGAC